MAFTICSLACMSPRSMRFASVTSCAAVSSSTLPIERRYRRSESRLGSTVRSSSGFLARLRGAARADRASSFALADAHPRQRSRRRRARRAGRSRSSLTWSSTTSTSSSARGDLLLGQVAALLPLRDKLAKLFESSKRPTSASSASLSRELSQRSLPAVDCGARPTPHGPHESTLPPMSATLPREAGPICCHDTAAGS